MPFFVILLISLLLITPTVGIDIVAVEISHIAISAMWVVGRCHWPLSEQQTSSATPSSETLNTQTRRPVSTFSLHYPTRSLLPRKKNLLLDIIVILGA